MVIVENGNSPLAKQVLPLQVVLLAVVEAAVVLLAAVEAVVEAAAEAVAEAAVEAAVVLLAVVEAAVEAAVAHLVLAAVAHLVLELVVEALVVVVAQLVLAAVALLVPEEDIPLVVEAQEEKLPHLVLLEEKLPQDLLEENPQLEAVEEDQLLVQSEVVPLVLDTWFLHQYASLFSLQLSQHSIFNSLTVL
jgi:hypothetical protein